MFTYLGRTNMKMKMLTRLILISVSLALLCSGTLAQRKMDRIERQTMKTILSTLKGQIKDKYYDPEYHGINLDVRFEQAAARLDEVDTTSQALTVIAQVLLDFNDSHLSFAPPLTNLDVIYGYQTRIEGDKCFVTTVQPKSDAEKKGLKPGDQILSVQGFRPNRRDMRKIDYLFRRLSRQATLNLELLKPGAEKPVKIAFDSKVKKRSVVITPGNFYKLFDTVGESQIDWNLFIEFEKTVYWKLPSFGMDPTNIDTLMSKTKGADSLILDLRGNGGGAVKTLERLSGYMFDEDFVIATPKGREKFDLMESKSKGSDVFKGKLVVLINNGSGSASEIFARTVQLKKRGQIMGDVSAGAVMMSRFFTSSVANDAIIYGANITIADVIMPDEKTIEHVGVTPDTIVLMTGEDIAKDRDPVIAAAVKYLGGNVTAEEAGGYFEYEWRYDDSVILKLSKKSSKKQEITSKPAASDAEPVNQLFEKAFVCKSFRLIRGL